MNNLTALLEGFADGQDVLIVFNNGNTFLLYDFEMVDESIYHRNDVVVATIREVVKSSFPYRTGTFLQFELGDIVSLQDPITGSSYSTI